MTPRTTASPTIVRITSAPALPTDGALPLDVPADATPGSSGVRSSWKAGAFFFALAAACFAVLAAGLALRLERSRGPFRGIPDRVSGILQNGEGEGGWGCRYGRRMPPGIPGRHPDP